MIAENVRGFSTPAARVTWNTTAPPQCVASVRVEFRTSSHVVANYTTTNASQTEFIQTGLKCTTNYSITVLVAGQFMFNPTLPIEQVEVLVGGKEIVCMRFNWQFDIPYHSQIYLLQLKWELKSLQTTQVSECHGSGHVRVGSCVLTLLE